MSAMCIVGKINFYDKLFIATIVPILMLGLLGLSYAGAMQLHRGTNMRANENRQQAKVRHASTALLVLFLVGFHSNGRATEGRRGEEAG